MIPNRQPPARAFPADKDKLRDLIAPDPLEDKVRPEEQEPEEDE